MVAGEWSKSWRTCAIGTRFTPSAFTPLLRVIDRNYHRTMIRSGRLSADYRGQDPVATLADLAEIRSKTVDYLKALPGNAWQRQGVFETDESIELWQSEGTISDTRVITLQWLGDQMCDHDREHLNQALHAVAS